MKKKTAQWLLAPLCALPVVGIIGCNGDNDSGGPTPNPTTSPTPNGSPTPIGSPTPGGSPTPSATATPRGNVGRTIIGLTANNEIVTFGSGSPGNVTLTRRITGLQGLDQLVGLDYRPANRQLYALSRTRLYRFSSLGAGTVQAVGSPFATALSGTSFGFDFNPVPDRIRVVSDTNLNLRINPDTGAIVDADTGSAGLQLDGSLAYASGDPNNGRDPNVVGSAYTNSVAGATSTTNYVIDKSRGILARQGSAEGTSPVVSPNTGRLFTVASLNSTFSELLGFDIAPGSNEAFLVFNGSGSSGGNVGGPQLNRINLNTGLSTPIGVIGSASNANRPSIIGIAVQP